MINTKRIEWLDGIKGLACILIFVHHFLLLFYPAIHFGEGAASHLDGFDTFLSQSPLSVIVNGNYLVMIFCCISGVVVSMQVMSLEDKIDLADIVAKRYLRLMLPLLPIGLLVYLSLRIGLFSNLQTVEFTSSPWASWYYNQELSFKEFLESVFVKTWFYGDDRLSNAYWMLSSLFTGTFLSIVLSIISWKYRKHVWIIYVFICALLFGNSDFHFAFCIGTLLAWMRLNCSKIFNRYVGAVAFIVGVFLGGYPSGVMPTNIYRFLGETTYFDWHIVGASLTIYGVWSLKILQNLFSLKIFRALGKISYSVYLIHIPLSFSLSTQFFLWFRDDLGYNTSVLLSFVVTTILLIVISCLYNRYVERVCGWITSRFFWFLSRDKLFDF